MLNAIDINHLKQHIIENPFLKEIYKVVQSLNGKAPTKVIIDLIELYLKHSNEINDELYLALIQLYREKGNNAKIEQLYKEGTELFPNSFALKFNMGIWEYNKDNYHIALECFLDAVEINSNSHKAYYNLGNCYRKLESYNDALLAYLKAFELNNNYLEALYNIGVVQTKLNLIEEAKETYKNILRINKNYHEAEWNLALLELRSEEWEPGWLHYDSRLKKKEFNKYIIPDTLWNGEDLTQKTILVLGEQGLGDNIQFFRYLSLLKKHKCKVILRVNRKLLNLLRDIDYVDEVRDDKETLNLEYDYYIPLLSLPKHFFNEFDFIRNSQYIFACEDKISYWKSKISDNGKTKIGLVWKGSEQNIDNKYRSIKLDSFEKMLSSGKYDIYSLQYGLNEIEKKYLDEKGINCFEENFDDTAAIIENMDLIVTVDTSMAHLSGALEKPTLLLLSHESDWRWGEKYCSTRWYKSIDIIRQKKDESWNDTINKALQFIDKLITLDFNDDRISEYYSDLGKVEQLNGNLEEAEVYYKSALFKNPFNPDNYNNLAIVCSNKNINYSISLLKKSLEIKFDTVALYNLGLLYQLNLRNDLAIKYYRMFLDKFGYEKNVVSNICKIYFDDGQLELAGQLLDSYDIIDSAIYYNKGVLEQLKLNLEKAHEYYLKSYNLEKSQETVLNLAYTEACLQNYDIAEQYLNELDQNNPDVIKSNAVLQFEKGNIENAIKLIENALEIDNNNVDYHLAYSEFLLSKGDYEKGFIENEWRLKKDFYKKYSFNFPEDVYQLNGKNILVVDEQGYGDTISFLRYIKELSKYGCNITVAAKDGLIQLLKSQSYIKNVIGLNYASDADYTVPLMSLPIILGPKRVPSSSNVLIVDEALKLPLPEELFKVGFVLNGNSYPLHNRKRHIDYLDFESVIKNTNAYFISLQKEKIEQYKSFNNFINADELMDDFYSTAKIINALDLVITIDSAVAHLSALLGKETFVMLPYQSDWRWKKHDIYSWYPDVKIFNQTKLGDWTEVIQQVYDNLKEKVNG